MTCQTCGRPAENGVPTHWLGCPEKLREHSEAGTEPDFSDSLCEYGDCTRLRREGSGKGAPPKYCEAHSNPKNRK